MSLRMVRRVVSTLVVFIAMMWMMLCLGAFPTATTLFGDISGISSEVLADLGPMGISLLVLGVFIAPTSLEDYKATRRRHEAKNKKAAAKAQLKKRKLDIRDNLTMKLSAFGSVVELEQLPYPVEESERVVQTMLKEDGALRYGEFEREDKSITKVVWIARHLKV